MLGEFPTGSSIQTVIQRYDNFECYVQSIIGMRWLYRCDKFAYDDHPKRSDSLQKAQ